MDESEAEASEAEASAADPTSEAEASAADPTSEADLPPPPPELTADSGEGEGEGDGDEEANSNRSDSPLACEEFDLGPPPELPPRTGDEEYYLSFEDKYLAQCLDEPPDLTKEINYNVCKNFELRADDELEKALIDLLRFDDEEDSEACAGAESVEEAGAMDGAASVCPFDATRQILLCPNCDVSLHNEPSKFTYVRVIEHTYQCQLCGQDSSRLRYFNERLRMQQDALILERVNSQVVEVETNFRGLRVSEDELGDAH